MQFLLAFFQLYCRFVGLLQSPAGQRRSLPQALQPVFLLLNFVLQLLFGIQVNLIQILDRAIQRPVISLKGRGSLEKPPGLPQRFHFLQPVLGIIETSGSFGVLGRSQRFIYRVKPEFGIVKRVTGFAGVSHPRKATQEKGQGQNYCRDPR